MKDIRIFVAAHKRYRMPQDGIYIPLQVGAANAEPIYAHTDADGENISLKNGSFCEVTGLYWIWKNAAADTVGLAHYRRHFGQTRLDRDPWKRILGRSRLEKLLERYDVVLPRKRQYWIETNLSHYAHAHNGGDLLKMRDCVTELFPEYLPSFDSVMRKTSGHRFNMMIMRKPVFDQYCAWLFPLLFKLEERIDISGYDAYNRRVFGFIAERMLDVWLAKNRIRYAELPVVYTEPVHWPAKCFNFLRRKFR